MIAIIKQVREKISAYQSILYLLSKPSNQEKYRDCPEVVTAILDGDVEAVKRWFKDDLDSKRLPELRNLAARMGIYPVYGKTRNELLILIHEKQECTLSSTGSTTSGDSGLVSSSPSQSSSSVGS